jgi:hypothetical protein
MGMGVFLGAVMECDEAARLKLKIEDEDDWKHADTALPPPVIVG